jgi:hypothetical protein
VYGERVHVRAASSVMLYYAEGNNIEMRVSEPVEVVKVAPIIGLPNKIVERRDIDDCIGVEMLLKHFAITFSGVIERIPHLFWCDQNHGCCGKFAPRMFRRVRLLATNLIELQCVMYATQWLLCGVSYLDHVIMLVVARLQAFRQPFVIHLVGEEHHVFVPNKGGRGVSKVEIQFT